MLKTVNEIQIYISDHNIIYIIDQKSNLWAVRSHPFVPFVVETQNHKESAVFYFVQVIMLDSDISLCLIVWLIFHF